MQNVSISLNIKYNPYRMIMMMIFILISLSAPTVLVFLFLSFCEIYL